MYRLYKILVCSTSCLLCLHLPALAEEQNPNMARNPFLPSQPPAIVALPNSVKRTTGDAITTKVPELHLFRHRLSYLSVEAALKIIKTLFPATRVTAEEISNCLLFMGTTQDNERIREALQGIDQPSEQITIEAKIISLNKESSKKLGVLWSWEPLPQRSETTSGGSSETDSSENGNFKFWHGYSFRFAATLNALFSKGQAKILASPSIVTLPGKEGSIFIGDHIPYQIDKHDSGGTYTSTEYIDAGISLKYTPILNEAKNLITTTVHTEVSTPSLVAELKNYKVTSRKIDTTVRLKDGETLVIGGLITEEEQKTLQKIPFLGDIPLLGNLFKNRTHIHDKTEIIMLLTPFITKAGESPAIFKNRGTSISQEMHSKHTKNPV